MNKPNPVLFWIRMIAVGIAFAIASLVMIIICLLRPFNPHNNYLFCKLVLLLIEKPLGVTFHIDETDAVYHSEPVVCVINHQGLLDILTFGKVIPKKSCTLAKRSLGLIPVWGQVFSLGGNILVDRASPKGRKHAMQSLNNSLQKSKTSLIIFPEGTRNRKTSLLPFRQGAFKIAKDNNVPIQPIVFSTYEGLVDFSRPRSHIYIKVLPKLNIPDDDSKILTEMVNETRAFMQRTKDELDQKVSAFYQS